MSLEGLRAWIGEVERKLAKRTRVFLVLAAIAIGIAGAAIYLAIDARESSVSESDVQALQEQLETRIDELGRARRARRSGTAQRRSRKRERCRRRSCRRRNRKPGRRQAGRAAAPASSAGGGKPPAGRRTAPAIASAARTAGTASNGPKNGPTRNK